MIKIDKKIKIVILVMTFLIPMSGNSITGNASIICFAPTLGNSACGPTYYSVVFTESGLISGTTWTATLNGASKSTSGTSITFSEASGSTYSFSIGATGYSASPSSGSLTVNSNVYQSVAFSYTSVFVHPVVKDQSGNTITSGTYTIYDFIFNINAGGNVPNQIGSGTIGTTTMVSANAGSTTDYMVKIVPPSGYVTTSDTDYISNSPGYYTPGYTVTNKLNVNGYVSDNMMGTAISGATVTIYEYTNTNGISISALAQAQTNTNGYYSLTGIVTGVSSLSYYLLRVYEPGYFNVWYANDYNISENAGFYSHSFNLLPPLTRKNATNPNAPLLDYYITQPQGVYGTFSHNGWSSYMSSTGSVELTHYPSDVNTYPNARFGTFTDGSFSPHLVIHSLTYLPNTDAFIISQVSVKTTIYCNDPTDSSLTGYMTHSEITGSSTTNPTPVYHASSGNTMSSQTADLITTTIASGMTASVFLDPPTAFLSGLVGTFAIYAIDASTKTAWGNSPDSNTGNPYFTSTFSYSPGVLTSRSNAQSLGFKLELTPDFQTFVGTFSITSTIQITILFNTGGSLSGDPAWTFSYPISFTLND